MKTTKQIAAIALLLGGLWVTGCDKKCDCDECPVSSELICSMKGLINVKVEDALRFSDVVEVILVGYDGSIFKHTELARGNWKEDGFTIVLPKTLDPNYLHTLVRDLSAKSTNTIGSSSPTVTISNRNVKVGDVTFWGVDKDDNVVTHFCPFMIDEEGNEKNIVYTYVDSDVTISGYTDRLIIFQPNIDWDPSHSTALHTHTTYSVEWKEGWNVWCLSTFYDKPNGIETVKWSTTPISDLKWHGSEDDLWLIN